jgi:hypothetical protein
MKWAALNQEWQVGTELLYIGLKLMSLLRCGMRSDFDIAVTRAATVLPWIIQSENTNTHC